MSLFNHFQRTTKETDTSKLCDSMEEVLPESIAHREMACIQSNLQQIDTKKRDALFTKKKKTRCRKICSSVWYYRKEPLGN